MTSTIELTKDSTPAEVQAVWAEKLRSGEYGQGVGALRDDDKFCCLGVLCDIAVDAGMGEWVEGDNFVRTGDDAEAEWGAYPPPEVQAWAGLVTNDGRLRKSVQLGDYKPMTLAGMNDSGLAPFAAIADQIETNLAVPE